MSKIKESAKATTPVKATKAVKAKANVDKAGKTQPPSFLKDEKELAADKLAAQVSSKIPTPVKPKKDKPVAPKTVAKTEAEMDAAFAKLLTQKNVPIDLERIIALKQDGLSATIKKFNSSLALGEMATNADDWFNSDKGQDQISLTGKKVTLTQFREMTFGFKKQWHGKIKRAFAISKDAKIYKQFTLACDKVESEGGTSERSIAKLLEYAKETEANEEAKGEDGEGAEPSVEKSKVDIEFKWTCATSDKRMTLKLFPDKSIKLNGDCGISEHLSVLKVLAIRIQQEIDNVNLDDAIDHNFPDSDVEEKSAEILKG